MIKSKLKSTFYKKAPLLFPRYTNAKSKNLCVSTLFYHQGLEMSIYSITSFFYQIGYSLPVFAVEDGSLTPNDKKELTKHFNLTLLDAHHSERKIEELFKRYPHLLKYRLSASSPYTKRKFDALLLSPYSRLIFIEADVLFMSRPDEIVRWIKRKSKDFFYLVHDRNYLGSFKREDLDYSFRLLLDKCKFKIASPTFNAGILCVPTIDRFDLTKLNKIFSYFNQVAYSNTIFAEETSLAILYHDLKGKALPPKKYVCPVTFQEYHKATSKKVVALHYIGESKQLFVRDALKNTIMNKFYRF